MQVTNREELVVNPGATLGHIAYQLEARHIIKSAKFLRLLAWYRGDAKKIKAGEYLIEPYLTPIGLLQKMVDGRVIQYSFTIIEGWKFSKLLSALHSQPKIAKTLAGCDGEAIAAKFAKEFVLPAQVGFVIPAAAGIQDLEGIFWPDTYFYTTGTTDVELLLRAYKIMQARLQQEWKNRENNIQLQAPKEALILASILEKEASLKTEYYEISGVFHRRLQKNMLLQADPTIIYALSETTDFKMPLKKADLTITSPYNTYKYPGLPPTPIAIPSNNALHAALHPADGTALYFVADGKGGHVFSATLEEHNKAVAEYRKRVVDDNGNK